MTFSIIQGDALSTLRTLPAESVHCCVTSPPYWGLRDYGADGQIGLEPTPDAYVARLVEVFREVRRVLRDDGTLWLNLGDSYASDTKGSGGTGKSTLVGTPNDGNGQLFGARKVQHGLKPKDLCIIPARVAMALQMPYYTGKIASESDRRWLAAMIDGEGCIYISRSKAGATTGRDRQYVRNQDAFDAGLRVTSTDVRLLEEIARIVGHGTVRACSNRTGKPAFDWSVYSGNARGVLREVYPFLVAKQHEARLMLGCPPSGDAATAAWSALKSIHKGGSTDVDFPAPASMFEPGWYLRSDIIWNKANPMPESVTDRPTKAHEYLFLLSKRERYYYDAEAIKEPAIHAGKVVTLGEKSLSRGQAMGMGVEPSGNGNADSVIVAAGRNRRSVWTVATHPFAEAHFAVMPPALVEPCIKAGCTMGGTVLDPFSGAGTVALVATRLQRNAIGIELNPEYVAMSERRIRGDAPLFHGVA